MYTNTNLHKLTSRGLYSFKLESSYLKLGFEIHLMFSEKNKQTEQ